MIRTERGLTDFEIGRGGDAEVTGFTLVLLALYGGDRSAILGLIVFLSFLGEKLGDEAKLLGKLVLYW